MLAGDIYSPGRIRLVGVPEPRLDGAIQDGAGEIIFQPELACLCGSDLLFFDAEYPEYPPVIGHSLHEMIGSVVESSGKRFRPGDRVLCVPVNQEGLFERFRVQKARFVTIGELDFKIEVLDPTVREATRELVLEDDLIAFDGP